jgi:multidrug efflux pump subunit AcrA (membrane-fusion protein)
MDIRKVKTTAPWKKTALILAFVGALVLVGSLLASPSYQYKVEQSSLLLGTVKRGDLQVTVDGYGVLRSDKQKLISSLAPATVEQVVLKAGAVVQADSVILRLSDPDLLQQIETASMATAQEQANFRRQQLNNQRDVLTEEGRLAELDARFQMLVLRHSAEAEMAAKGIAKQLQLQQQRLEQLRLVNEEALTISQEQLNQAMAREQRLKQRQEQLTVKAGMEGVLQRVPVELGQSVTAGQELALVGSDKDLLALVRVSQSKAEQIQPGQKARVNTRREQANAVVSRVTPQVVDGTIEVELTFVDAIPASARPELTIDAQIFTAELTNTLYLERPVNSQSHSKSRLFKLDPQTYTLAATAVQFGDEAGRFLQLQQGATEGEQFVLSDMAGFQDANTIRVMR